MSANQRWMLAVGLIVLNGAVAHAQELAPSQRKLSDVPIAPNAPAVQPSPAPTVRNPSIDPGKLAGRRMLPEGSLVSGMSGALFRTAGNDVIFLPDKTEPSKSQAASTQPFVLVPSQKLGQLESATKTSESDTSVVVSGQVYVYRNRQYLLLTAYSIKQASGPKDARSSAPVAPATSKATQTTQAADPRVEDLIRDLESERGGSRLLDPAPDADRPVDPVDDGAAAESDGSAERLVAEGTLINSRRGRLIRVKSSGGRLGFAFDNDPDSPATPPMIIVPCAMLTNMEVAARTHGDELAFTVSGRILAHEGRNYLLPVLYQVRRPTDVKSLQ